MDGTENQQDNPSVDTKGTPEEQSQTYTEADVRKVRSDAQAEIGRYKKAANEATEAAKKAQANADAIEERFNRFLKEQDEAELYAARDNPDRLTQLRETQRRREAEAKAEKLEKELKTARELAETYERESAKITTERNAREIAEREGVDVKALIDFTDGSTEKMEALAKVLPKSENKQVKPKLKPDSGVTMGGGTRYTTSQIKQMDKTAFAEFQKATGNKSVLQLIQEGVVIEK